MHPTVWIQIFIQSNQLGGLPSSRQICSDTTVEGFAVITVGELEEFYARHKNDLDKPLLLLWNESEYVGHKARLKRLNS